MKLNIVDSSHYKQSDDATTTEKTNIIKNTVSNEFISSKDYNEFNKNIKIKEETFILNTKQNSKKSNVNNKTKYKILLDKFRKNKRDLKETKYSYNKLRKINKFLKYKSYFEFGKQISINSSIFIYKLDISIQGTNNNSMKITKNTEDKEEKILNKRLLEKLEENIQIFEQLENEIISKDNLISNLNLIIDSQKSTIDKLVVK